jgi:hypothetical protein
MRGVVGIVLLAFGPIWADTVEVNLFDLGCQRNFNNSDPSWSSDFDLGVFFNEISHIYIDWSGQITASLWVSDYDPGNPFPGDEGISAYLGSNPWPRDTEIYGGQETYPLPEPFDQISTFSLSQTSSWSDLLDGQGTIYISRSGLVSEPELHYYERGSIELNNAILIFEGTIIPEPSSLLLMVTGLLGLLSRNRKKQ